MFILRLIWIIVFLAASSLLPGLPMLECRPTPTSSAFVTEAPWDERLNRTRTHNITFPASPSATSRSTLPKPPRNSSSTLWRRHDEEDEDAEEEDTADDDLQTTIIRKYALHSVCSGRNIHLMGKRFNHVRADAPSNDLYAQLTVRSIRPGEVSISNDLSRRYLCFNRHGKLIMRLEFRENTCVFHERVQQNHIVLQSSRNKAWFVGFDRDGRSLQGNEWRKKQPKTRGCYNFHKVGEKVFASAGDVNHQEKPAHHQKTHRLAKKHFTQSLSSSQSPETLPSLKTLMYHRDSSTSA